MSRGPYFDARHLRPQVDSIAPPATKAKARRASVRLTLWTNCSTLTYASRDARFAGRRELRDRGRTRRIPDTSSLQPGRCRAIPLVPWTNSWTNLSTSGTNSERVKPSEHGTNGVGTTRSFGLWSRRSRVRISSLTLEVAANRRVCRLELIPPSPAEEKRTRRRPSDLSVVHSRRSASGGCPARARRRAAVSPCRSCAFGVGSALSTGGRFGCGCGLGQPKACFEPAEYSQDRGDGRSDAPRCELAAEGPEGKYCGCGEEFLVADRP
jgi:hypothetical protein